MEAADSGRISEGADDSSRVSAPDSDPRLELDRDDDPGLASGTADEMSPSRLGWTERARGCSGPVNGRT